MLHDPARHEPLNAIPWDEDAAREAIAHIVRRTEARFSAHDYWPLHPRDIDGGDDAPAYALYHGACGVIWALSYLESCGAAPLGRDYRDAIAPLSSRNTRWLRAFGCTFDASYLMGDTGILLLDYRMNASSATADRLAALIGANLDNPTRELMWGSPGTMLAALFLHGRTGDERFAELFRTAARRLWAELEWSPQYRCRYWTQDMYGQRSSYLDAVHGFVATASPLIRGRHLLEPGEWQQWQACIEDTIRKTALREGACANWRAWLHTTPGRAPHFLMQFCHGAPGFVICLGDAPGSALDDLLLAGGEATWHAGPLLKGSNLCHGTAGNGYAFLKLFRRTGDAGWLARARAFAMHAIGQMRAEEAQVGELRYSLWTGDPGLAIYLVDCIRGEARFPTLDVF
jgi:Lanthionine synthetase C-like protein